MSGGGFGGVPYGGGPYGGGSSVPAFSNLGFEIPGARAGFAAGWTVSQQSSAFEIGGYFSAQNLVLWSEALDHAPWVPIQASVAPGAARAWDDGAPADALVDTTAMAAHVLEQATLAETGFFYFSVEAKAGAVDHVFLEHGEGGFAIFNLANGSVVSSGGGAVASINPRGRDGWYWCEIAITAVSDGRYAIAAATSGGVPYAGTGTAALYLARASILSGDALGAGIGYTKTTDTPVDLSLPWENFEQLWGNNGAGGHYRFAFGTGSTALGLYDAANTEKPREDFETGWIPPRPYLSELVLTAAGLYHRGDVGDPIAFEEFEAGWVAGTYRTAFAPEDLETGLFNGGTDAVERWEEVEPAYLDGWPGGGLGVYGGHGDAVPYEDFDTTVHGIASFTADAGTDYITAPGNDVSLTTPLILSTTGTLPAPLLTKTPYWPVSLGGGGAGTFKLSASPAGSPINLTDSGSGVHSAAGFTSYVWRDPITTW